MGGPQGTENNPPAPERILGRDPPLPGAQALLGVLGEGGWGDVSPRTLPACKLPGFFMMLLP